MNRTSVRSVVVILALVVVAFPMFGQDSLNIRRIGGVDCPGPATGVELVGHYAYVNSTWDRPMLVADISQPTAPVVVNGHAAVTLSNVTVVGNYAYGSSDRNFVAVDISDPVHPVQVGSFNGNAGEGTGIGDVLIVGHYALCTGGEWMGVYVLDISDPTHPVHVCSLPGGLDTIGELALWGNYLYVQDSYGPFRIMDISDPENAVVTVRGGMSAGWYQVTHEGYLYTNDYDGVRVYNLADPLNPVQVALTSGINGIWSMQVSGHYLYVNTLETGLHVLDIADPSAIVEVGNLNPGTTIEDFVVAGSVVYYASYYEGLRIVDFSDPANPLQLSRMQSPNGPKAILMSGSYLYNAAGAAGLEVLQISDDNTMSLIASVRCGNVVKVLKRDNTLFVATSDSGLRVFDVTNPQNPERLTLLNGALSSIGGMAWMGDYLCAYSGPSLGIYDVSEPIRPTRMSQVVFTGNGSDLTAMCTVGNLIYVTTYDTLRIIDASDPQAPIRAGRCEFTWQGGAGSLAVNGHYLYNVTSGRSVVGIVYVADPNHPAWISDFMCPNTIWSRELCVAGNHLFVAGQQGGLQVYDLTVPTAPVLVGFNNAAGSASCLAVDGDWVFVGDGDDVGIYDCSMALGADVRTAPQVNEFALEPCYPNPFNAVTTVGYDLPSASQTELAVFDIAGRRVATLSAGVQSAGHHTIRFDGENLASGVYFLRLNAGRLHAEQKAMLLK